MLALVFSDLLRNRSLLLLTVSYSAVGYFEYVFFYWMGYYFENVVKLNTEINKALQSPILRERYAAIEAEPVGGTPEEFAAFVKKETVKWAEVVRKSGAKLD